MLHSNVARTIPNTCRRVCLAKRLNMAASRPLSSSAMSHLQSHHASGSYPDRITPVLSPRRPVTLSSPVVESLRRRSIHSSAGEHNRTFCYDRLAEQIACQYANMVTSHGQSPGLGKFRFLYIPRSHCSPTSRIKLHFKDSKGHLIKTIEANEGDDILSIAHEHDIDLEGVLSLRMDRS